MQNTQNVTIVLLLITASVLTSLLVASYVYTQPTAYAHAAGAKEGDYIMTIGTYNQETDFVYVLDIANAKLNVYYPNVNTNALALGDTVDLSRAFGVPAKP